MDWKKRDETWHHSANSNLSIYETNERHSKGLNEHLTGVFGVFAVNILLFHMMKLCFLTGEKEPNKSMILFFLDLLNSRALCHGVCKSTAHYYSA